MLLPAPPLYPRRRNPRERAQSPAPPTPVALAMVGVQDVVGGEGQLAFVALFNTTEAAPLAALPVWNNPGKWSARYDGIRYGGESLVKIAFDRISIVMIEEDPDDPGPDEVSYSNNPSDVFDELGRGLGAFGGFPI